MSDYINKVKTADGQEYDVQDKRIEAIYTQAEKEKLGRMQEVFTTAEKMKLDSTEIYSTEEKEKLANIEPLTEEEKEKIEAIQEVYTETEKEKLAELKNTETDGTVLKVNKVNIQKKEVLGTFNNIDYYHKSIIENNHTIPCNNPLPESASGNVKEYFAFSDLAGTQEICIARGNSAA